MDCSPPVSSVHRISQVRILGQVASSFSRGSSWSRDQAHVFCITCIGKQIFYHWAITTREAPEACDQGKISLLYDWAQNQGEVHSHVSQLQVRWATDVTWIFLRDSFGVQPTPKCGLPSKAAIDSEGCYQIRGQKGKFLIWTEQGTQVQCMKLAGDVSTWQTLPVCLPLHILCCQHIYLGNWSLQSRLSSEAQVMCTLCQAPGLKSKARTFLTGQVKGSSDFTTLWNTERQVGIAMSFSSSHRACAGEESLLYIASCHGFHLRSAINNFHI